MFKTSVQVKSIQFNSTPIQSIKYKRELSSPPSIQLMHVIQGVEMEGMHEYSRIYVGKVYQILFYFFFVIMVQHEPLRLITMILRKVMFLLYDTIPTIHNRLSITSIQSLSCSTRIAIHIAIHINLSLMKNHSIFFSSLFDIRSDRSIRIMFLL